MEARDETDDGIREGDMETRIVLSSIVDYPSSSS